MQQCCKNFQQRSVRNRSKRKDLKISRETFAPSRARRPVLNTLSTISDRNGNPQNSFLSAQSNISSSWRTRIGMSPRKKSTYRVNHFPLAGRKFTKKSVNWEQQFTAILSRTPNLMDGSAQNALYYGLHQGAERRGSNF